jgi:tripartite-type tricarboxylate transporter receptor subunit TctC
MHRRSLLAAAAAGTALRAVPTAHAQARYPSRPVTIYGALPAAGVMDQHLRALGERVQKTLGQPVVVEARPGAGATLAPQLIQAAAPDGHLLAAMTVNSLRYPYYQKTPYDPIRDFTFIVGLSNFTFGIVVHADSPYRSIEDLVAAGKANPGKLACGSTGQGGTGHLIQLDIEKVTGARFTQVPFKGGPDNIQALLGKHIDFVADSAFWGPLVDDGRLRLLAMATEQRVPRFKDAPTLRERGIDAVGWSPYGLVGPRGMAPEIVRALHDAFKAAMEDPAIDALLEKFVQVRWYKSSADYRSWAEKYFVDIKPTLMRAGLMQG